MKSLVFGDAAQYQHEIVAHITIVMYPRPNVITCTIRVWLREIGFSLTYGALMLKTWRISVIFRVKSAKAVKITDMNLLKRLGIIVTIFSVFLGIRTIVAPPVVIVGRTADDLKAYLCRTDWWDHSFTTLEVMFLVWGIRLCIVVRKAPSEFNESRFISAYVVFRGGSKEDAMSKLPGTTGKFIGKSCRVQGVSNQTNSISLQQANFTEEGDGVTEEFRRFYTQLELLKEKNLRMGNRHLAAKLLAMQVAANQTETQILAIQEIPSTLRFNKQSIVSVEESSAVDVARKLNADDYLEVCKDSGNKIVESVQLHIEEGNEKHSENVNTMEQINSEDNNKEISSMTVEKNMNTAECNKKVSTIESDNVNLQTVTLSTSMPSSSNIVANLNEHSDTLNTDTKVNEIKEDEVHKSGHARTHAIVINLDDKSRFSEEVTV
ncbi:hypothetical protein PV327_003247 [Microctonus hyperodae]|uniref:G-protein coupled receptors family 3 profile domain-containing protein n=1 Tax=Microctonus hyperodae TaxID=165561 RepID=A0AA39G3L9_MICHY|nr:hypothetical protein PV327_003247 [Microctonus hyperodae]